MVGAVHHSFSPLLKPLNDLLIILIEQITYKQ